jgi:uncharacterized protein (TIGR04255 family)
MAMQKRRKESTLMTQTTTPTVTYTNTPLVDVTCQLTFPQNLKISAAPPVGFQEKVKDMFPLFALTQDKTAYNFMSTDQRWQLVLGKGALTLVARQYDGWMNFSKYLQGAMAALEQEYPPQFVIRVGLRFRNIIRKSALGVTDKEWNQLLQAKWTGDLAWAGTAGEMKATHSEVLMGLNGGKDLVCVRHGLVPIAQPIQEMGYLIDHDFFVDGQFAMSDVPKTLNDYHQSAQRFFKLWVTDTLHQAMKPKA